MKVLVNSTPVALWRDIVHEAEATCATPLIEELESYLVFLLVRYMTRPEVVKQIMATQFLESLKLAHKERELALQQVGDACLLLSGLFPGIAEKRLVKISYFINIGRSAYATISRESDDVYGLLTQEFVLLMDVLQSVRQYTRECPDLLPIQAYDLWNESGSKRALRILRQYSKGMPAQTMPRESDMTFLIKIK